MRRILILIATLLTVAPALAGPLDGPKAQGLIGERPDGYVGFVVDVVPVEVKALVDKTNAERRAEYEKIAKQRGTSVEAVEAIFGEKLVAKASPGSYVMTPDGKWVKKQ